MTFLRVVLSSFACFGIWWHRHSGFVLPFGKNFLLYFSYDVSLPLSSLLRTIIQGRRIFCVHLFFSHGFPFLFLFTPSSKNHMIWWYLPTLLFKFYFENLVFRPIWCSLSRHASETRALLGLCAASQAPVEHLRLLLPGFLSDLQTCFPPLC